MTKYFIGLLFALTLSSISAQITVNPNPLVMKTTTVDSTLKYDMYFTNTKDTTYKIYWMLSPGANWPAQWTFQLCDSVLCYAEGATKSSNNLPNIFPNYKTVKFYINLNTKGIPGTSSLNIKLFTGKNCQGEIFSAPISVVNSRPSGSLDLNDSDIELYPNPATDYFQIKYGSLVDRVDVYNLLGYKVKTSLHNNDSQHEIEELKNGTYVVKMYDKKGTKLKTVKLNKISENN